MCRIVSRQSQIYVVTVGRLLLTPPSSAAPPVSCVTRVSLTCLLCCYRVAAEGKRWHRSGHWQKKPFRWVCFFPLFFIKTLEKGGKTAKKNVINKVVIIRCVFVCLRLPVCAFVSSVNSGHKLLKAWCAQNWTLVFETMTSCEFAASIKSKTLSLSPVRWSSSRRLNVLRNSKVSACGWPERPVCWPIRAREQSQVTWASCRRGRKN